MKLFFFFLVMALLAMGCAHSSLVERHDRDFTIACTEKCTEMDWKAAAQKVCPAQFHPIPSSIPAEGAPGKATTSDGNKKYRSYRCSVPLTVE